MRTEYLALIALLPANVLPTRAALMLFANGRRFGHGRSPEVRGLGGEPLSPQKLMCNDNNEREDRAQVYKGWEEHPAIEVNIAGRALE